ncbi:hypothetical protein HII36_18755 [Nonomuraea sp. NN258]|uniref:serine hydrolase n=1 Tax=Nonomuraea antri TaxID=2730852 RepID=UPI0015681FDF|nr:serine hydrolase [Nonomuraea antri]NRQ33878.1 hypothetical protein [Nonomuraea antri]
MAKSKLLAAVLAAAAAVTGCGGPPAATQAGTQTGTQAGTETGTQAGTQTGTTAPPTSTAPPAEIPDTPLGDGLRWVIDASARAPIAQDELTARFSADFLAQISAAQVNQLLMALKGLRVEQVTIVHDKALSAVIAVGGKRGNLQLSMDDAGKINGLGAQEEQPPPPAPKSWGQLERRLKKAAPGAGFVAAELTRGGDCRQVRAVSSERERPLGSMVKLYVLGTVSEQIERGRFRWDTELTIKPELKSVPSGVLQDRPDNSRVTVFEAAELMISISDNTATDLLLHHVGRKAVERTMRRWGVRDERNLPLLSTRELTVLKGADYPRHAERYLSLDVPGRRAYLADVVAGVPLTRIIPWSGPRELDTIEWFASPADVCRAHAELARLDDPKVGEAMTAGGPALKLDENRWSRIWFKGGAEPGVYDLSFSARHADGRTFAVTLMATGAFDEMRAAQEFPALAAGAFELARRHS